MFNLSEYFRSNPSEELTDKEDDITEQMDAISTSMADEEKEKTVQQDFLPKAKKLVTSLPFVRDMVAGYYCLTASETPLHIKGAITVPLVYFVIPVDAIPDFIAVAGYSDDIAAWYAALKVFGHYITDEHYAEADELLNDADENPEN